METTNIVSIGYAAQLLQAMPNRIREVAQACRIEPACRINNIDHYSEESLEQIRSQLRPSVGDAGQVENVKSRTATREEKARFIAAQKKRGEQPVQAAIDEGHARADRMVITPQRRQRGA